MLFTHLLRVARGMNNNDKLTKGLLAVIAVALWMIALNSWLRPVAVETQSDSYLLSSIDNSLESITSDVSSIEGDVGIIRIQTTLNLE